jgi:Flp pilus assembly protein TadG
MVPSPDHSMIRRSALRRMWSDGEGTAIVEFALVLPFLLILVWGIVDLSRLFQAVNAVTGAVREGARSAALVSPSDTGAAATTQIQNIVTTELQEFGAPAPYTAQVQVAWAAPVDSVWATFTFQPLTPLIPSVQFTRSASFLWEQAATAP